MSEKRPRGRPSKVIKDEKRKKLISLMFERGFTDGQVSTIFNVTRKTLFNWKKKDFLPSLKTDKSKADGKVEKALYERATGYSHPEEKIFCDKGQIIRANTIRYYPPDPTSMIFWLKNRKPEEWRDKHELEGKGFGDTHIYANLSSEQLEKMAVQRGVKIPEMIQRRINASE